MTISTPTVSGQILTSAYVNNNINSGLVYITSDTMAAASKTFSNVFSTEYDNYVVQIVTTASSAAGSNNVVMRMGTTATGYVGSVGRSFSTTVNAVANPADSFFLAAVTTASHSFQATCQIMSPFLAQSTVCNHQGFAFNSLDNINYFGGQLLSNTTSYTDLTLLVTSGTITGRITVYGYRKA
jgi:hypothetical protein